MLTGLLSSGALKSTQLRDGSSKQKQKNRKKEHCGQAETCKRSKSQTWGKFQHAFLIKNIHAVFLALFFWFFFLPFLNVFFFFLDNKLIYIFLDARFSVLVSVKVNSQFHQQAASRGELRAPEGANRRGFRFWNEDNIQSGYTGY